MSGFLKKVFLVIGIFLGLAAIVAIVAPLVVDVDRYRPLIEQAADEHLNGRLELGKLSLSLWGQIRIEIGGMKVLDMQGQPVVAVSDAYFHIPFASVLGGAPDLILKLRQPELDIVKDRSGKLNLLSLLKDSPGAPPAPGGQAASPSRQATGEVTLPGIAARARLGIECANASVSYRDDATKLTTQVRDLNLIVHDISLSHEMTARIWADLDTEMRAAGKGGGGMVVKGPVRLSLTGRPVLVDRRLDHMDVSGRLSLDELDIRYGAVFRKAAGVDAHADLTATVSPGGARIDQLDVKFFNAELRGHGDVKTVALAASAAQVDFSLKSNAIELRPWSQLVPMLSQYELGGDASFDASAHGPSDKLGYRALLKLDGLTAKAPNFKEQPRIDALVSVVTDQVDDLTLTMSAPGNDLKIHGKIVSFAKPRADFEVVSSGMDLDRLIELPPPGAPAQAAAAETGAPAAAKVPADHDALAALIRENKMIAGAVATLGVNIRSIKMRGASVTDLTSRMSFRDLVAGIDQLQMKAFGGAVKASAQLNFKPPIPSYRFGAAVEGVDLKQAVASQYHLFKNTVLGKAHFEVNGAGESLDPARAIENLKAKGKLRVDNATFATIDVRKMVTDAINKALAPIESKIPGLTGMSTGVLPGGALRYQTISTDFTIAGGKFNAPDFVAKAAPKQGVDLKGGVTVGLTSYSLNTAWEVIDTYNLTHAKDVTVPGTSTPLLAERGQPVKFPVSAGCTLTAPCYSYGQAPGYLMKVAMNNLARGAAQAQLRKQAGDLIKQAPPQLQSQLNNLSKKLFGH